MSEINFTPNVSAEAIAGSGSMQVTGVEKELDRIAESEGIPKNLLFLKSLSNVIESIPDSNTVTEVRTRDDGNRRSGKENKEKKFSKLLQSRENAIPPISSGFNFTKDKGREEPISLDAAGIDKIGAKPTIDPKLIKEYAVLFARKLSGPPADKMEKISIRLEEIKDLLKRAGLKEELFLSIEKSVKKNVLEEISYLIKSFILNNLGDPRKLISFLFKNKTPQSAFNFVFFNDKLSQANAFAFNEKDSMELKILKQTAAKNAHFKTGDSKALFGVAKELGVKLDEWMNTWNFEKIDISKEGEITINKRLIEMERDKNLLLDELRMLEVERLLEDDWGKLFFLLIRQRRLVDSLAFFDVSSAEIDKIKTQARKIGWIKCIAILKETHLKRVFSSSQKEFNHLSNVIRKLTVKARSLGIEISREGIQWIESRLETLGIETATYKLNLLNSMQKINYDKDREKDIKWLGNTVHQLKDRRENIDAFFHFIHWIQSKAKDLLSK